MPTEDALIDMCFVHQDTSTTHEDCAADASADAQAALEAAEMAVAAAEVATEEAQEENASLRAHIRDLEHKLEQQREQTNQILELGLQAPRAKVESEQGPRQYTARERLLRENADKAEAAAEHAEKLLVSVRATLRMQHMAEVMRCPPGRLRAPACMFARLFGLWCDRYSHALYCFWTLCASGLLTSASRRRHLKCRLAFCCSVFGILSKTAGDS